MALSKIKVPLTEKSFYTEVQSPMIKKEMESIFNLYGKFITQSSKLCNVPVELIKSVIFIESSGKANAVSHAGAIGLMQITPDTATNTIHIENKQKRLSDVEKGILRKVLGSRLDCILQMKYMNQPLKCNNNSGSVVTKQDLFDPEFNILVGSILLGLLIDQHTENGNVRLDKIIVRYNAGYNYKPQGATIEETMKFASKKGGKETVAYITKLVGKHGTLDVLV